MPLTRHDVHDLILLQDSLEADGGFMLAHIFKLLLGIDGHHAVVLVAIRHSMPHYSLMFRKIGLNVATLASAGRVVFVDALKSASKEPISLRSLSLAVDQAVGGRERVCVVYDDLTVLSSFASSNDELTAFLHYAVIKPPCCVAVVHGDVVYDVDRWVLRLHHQAATVVHIESLKTGRSAQVGGRIHVDRRRQPVPVASVNITVNTNSNSQGGEDVLLGIEEKYFALGPDGSVRFF